MIEKYCVKKEKAILEEVIENADAKFSKNKILIKNFNSEKVVSNLFYKKRRKFSKKHYKTIKPKLS